MLSNVNWQQSFYCGKMKISNKMQKILDIFECKIYITYCKVIDGIALLLQAIKVNDERWMR